MNQEQKEEKCAILENLGLHRHVLVKLCYLYPTENIFGSVMLTFPPNLQQLATCVLLIHKTHPHSRKTNTAETCSVILAGLNRGFSIYGLTSNGKSEVVHF